MGDDADRLLIISSDGHIGAPVEQYRPYMDPKYVADFDDWFNEYIPMWLSKGTKAKDSVKGIEDQDYTMWGSEYEAEFERRTAEIPWGIEGKWDAKKRLEALDIDGVAADVMFPDDQSANGPPFIGANRDARLPWDKYSPELRQEGARAYNRWLADFCSEDPDRLLGVAMLGTLADVDGAIETATWAKEHGLNGGLYLPVMYYNNVDPFWNDPCLDPLWAAVQDLDMPLTTHVGPGSPYYGDDPFSAWILWSLESRYWPHRPLWFMIIGGVLERFPRLKLVFTEQGVEWVAPMLQSMDGLLNFKMTPFSEDERKEMFSIKPSEYFQRQVWIGATNTDALGWVSPEDLEYLGYKKLMWGSDYPHMESFWPHTRETLRGLLKGIPDYQARAIVADNAIECYSLDRTKLETVAARIGPAPDEIITT
jgi:predicted TIM-barrel fold metal-dependent hydrolase